MSITIADTFLYYREEMTNCLSNNIGCSDELGNTGVTPYDINQYSDDVLECANSQLTSVTCDKVISGDVVFDGLSYERESTYTYGTIQKQNGEENMDLNSILNGALDAGSGMVIFYILLALWMTIAFKFVGEKRAIVYKWFGGKYSKTLNAGFNFKFPFPIYTQHEVVHLELFKIEKKVGVKSSDNAFLQIPVNLQLRIIKGKEKEAVFELDNPREQLFDYVYNTIVNVANDMEMVEIFKSKDKFETEVEKLKEEFESFGYKIHKVLIEDPQLTSDMEKSFEDVLVAKRNEEAAEYDANAEMITLVGSAKAKSEGKRTKLCAERLLFFS